MLAFIACTRLGTDFLPETGSLGKSKQGSCLCEGRRRVGQDERFREEGGEDVTRG